jgi:hypothetical protein
MHSVFPLPSPGRRPFGAPEIRKTRPAYPLEKVLSIGPPHKKAFPTLLGKAQGLTLWKRGLLYRYPFCIERRIGGAIYPVLKFFVTIHNIGE